MLSVDCMGEPVGALGWLYGRASGCSQLVVPENQWMLSVGWLGEPVGAFQWVGESQ